MDSETLLRCLVGDLLGSTWTGGSDERMYAHQWLDRRFGPEWLIWEELDAKRAEKQAKKAAARPVHEIPDYFDSWWRRKEGKANGPNP